MIGWHEAHIQGGVLSICHPLSLYKFQQGVIHVYQIYLLCKGLFCPPHISDAFENQTRCRDKLHRRIMVGHSASICQRLTFKRNLFLESSLQSKMPSKIAPRFFWSTSAGSRITQTCMGVYYFRQDDAGICASVFLQKISVLSAVCQILLMLFCFYLSQGSKVYPKVRRMTHWRINLGIRVDRHTAIVQPMASLLKTAGKCCLQWEVDEPWLIFP